MCWRGKLDLRKKDLGKKTATLQAQEQATQERLKADEDTTKQQIGAVTADVNGVRRGDVGKVSADVSDTKNDLAATKGKLDHAIGDLNKHSELIATSHDELENAQAQGAIAIILNLTLKKDKEPTHLSIVSLQLKKTDPKKSKFTLYVLAGGNEDRKEKITTINEPLSFIVDASARYLK